MHLKLPSRDHGWLERGESDHRITSGLSKSTGWESLGSQAAKGELSRLHRTGAASDGFGGKHRILEADARRAHSDARAPRRMACRGKTGQFRGKVNAAD